MPYKDPKVGRVRRKQHRLENHERFLSYESQYRAEHQDQIQATRARFKENHPDYRRMDAGREQRNEGKRAFYARHKVRLSAERKPYNAQRYIQQKDKILKNTRAWQKANPEQVTHINARRRARKAEAGGHHTLKEWQEKKALYGFRCYYCGKKPKRLEREHIIAVSLGGTDDISNIVPACRSCNGKKHAKPLSEFLLTVQGQLLIAF